MNRVNAISIFALCVGTTLLFTTRVYAEGMEDLAIYKSGGPTQGLWRIEMLSSDDPNMSKMSGMVNQMAICMDTAKQMGKDMQSKDSQNKCSNKIVRNTSSVAEVEVSCESGMHSHMTVTREGDNNFLLDTHLTSKDGKERNFKARYKYDGACKSNALIQMDKNSEACKQMGNVDLSKMTAMCANMPPEQRGQCEQRMKQAGEMCK
jgi:hypothetical protein